MALSERVVNAALKDVKQHLNLAEQWARIGEWICAHTEADNAQRRAYDLKQMFAPEAAALAVRQREYIETHTGEIPIVPPEDET